MIQNVDALAGITATLGVLTAVMAVLTQTWLRLKIRDHNRRDLRHELNRLRRIDFELQLAIDELNRITDELSLNYEPRRSTPSARPQLGIEDSADLALQLERARIALLQLRFAIEERNTHAQQSASASA